MTKNSFQVSLIAIATCVVAGCPSIFSRGGDDKTEIRERTDATEKTNSDSTSEAAEAAATGESAGAGASASDGLSGSQAIELAQLDEPLKPAPDEATLCMLYIGQTRVDAAKATLGKPRTESMSNDGATLSYLYADGRSLFLQFASIATDHDIGLVPTAWEYFFSEAEVTRMNYPKCWRHETSSD